jgi:hypothetical protein
MEDAFFLESSPGDAADHSAAQCDPETYGARADLWQFAFCQCSTAGRGCCLPEIAIGQQITSVPLSPKSLKSWI